MTFRDVAYKNFKGHIRKYMSYFLCSSFSVMIFFMYMTLIFNRDIVDYLDYNKAGMIIPMVVTAVSVFSIFFINYSHFSFVKSRNGEFGLYLTLGMNKRDIGRIILVENVIIAVFSTAIGIISGIVFSRIFFLAVVRFLNIPEVRFVLDYRQFGVTLLTFAAIFTCVILISRISTRKLEITDLMKQERKIRKERLAHPAWGAAGIFALLAYLAGILWYSALKSKDLILMESILVVGFIGIYLIISNFGTLLISAVRKRRNLYYKRILGISEINQKFHQNKKIVFVISVLGAILVCMMSMPVSIYPQMGDIAQKVMFSDLEYVEVGSINRIPAAQLDKLLDGGKTAVTGNSRLEFINAVLLNGDTRLDKLVIPESQLEKISGKEIPVAPGRAVNIIFNTYSGKPMSPAKQLEVSVNGSAFRFGLQDELTDNLLGIQSCPADSLVLLCDKDYNSIKASAAPKDIGYVHFINFRDWRKSGEIISKLTGYLQSTNTDPASAYYVPASRDHFYEGARGIYSMFLFVTSFSALLFFIASACVLFFKQYTELEDTRQKYGKLFKIGICRREAVSFITSEMKLTYFMPVLVGMVIGYPMLYSASGIFMDFYHSDSMRSSLMQNALWVIAGYLAFQAVFYLAAKARFVREVIGTGAGQGL